MSILALYLLSGCGGGSRTANPSLPIATESPVTTTNSVTKIGQLVDSPVANIGYRTNTRSGYTNANGEFEYEEGEVVTFFIGDIVFPPSAANTLLTPLNMANSDDILSPTTINIIRLLQSLDADGNPYNGIVIPASAGGLQAYR